jgi:tRNA A22 N-methylase
MYATTAAVASAGGRRAMEIINKVASKHKIVTDIVIQANYLKGKMAEKAIQTAFQIKDSATQVRYYLENGAYRIFDFVKNNHFIEVKNAETLKFCKEVGRRKWC